MKGRKLVSSGAYGLLISLLLVSACQIAPAGILLDLPTPTQAGYVQAWSAEARLVRPEDRRIRPAGITQVAYGRVECELLDGAVPNLKDFEVFGVRVVETPRGYELSIPVGPNSPIPNALRPPYDAIVESRPFQERGPRPNGARPNKDPEQVVPGWSEAEGPTPCMRIVVRTDLGRKIAVVDFVAPDFVKVEAGEGRNLVVELYAGLFLPAAAVADRLVIPFVVSPK
jgi:hypothetical protein